jgi:phosphoribosylglycinamide formyltransferase-1
LASGSGTNLQAILDTVHGEDGIEVVAVGSDKAEARALRRAQELGIATRTFPVAEFSDREARDAAIGDWLEEQSTGLIVLAGYMQLLSPTFIRRFEGRIINVHPALLPSFRGLDAIGQALAEGVKITGVTVHFVDEGVDTGAIIRQRAVPVPVSRNREELEEAIHATEHSLLPAVVSMIAAGSLHLDPDSPRIVLVD